jgi:hypothetical protein
MKRTILTLTIATLLITPALRAEEVKHSPINPALLYWQAASQLPQRSEDQATQLNDLAGGRQPFDAAKAKGLLDAPNALRLIRKAAESTADCDWGLPMEDGPLTLLPHLAKIREMSSLAIAQAESLFSQGKVKEGTEWLLTAHRMARHSGAGDMLISNLVQYAIETNALRAAARHCLDWDEATRRSYAAELKSLPPLHSTQAAYRGERIFADWIEKHFSQPDMTPEAIKGLTKDILGDYKPEDKATILSELSAGNIHKVLAELRALEDRRDALLSKPWKQGTPELAALGEEIGHSQYLLVRSTLPSVISVPEKQYVVATLQHMLEAALQYGRQLDEKTAATYHDEFEGEPLRLQKGEDGTLTLVAAHPHPAGKDITLRLGK